MTCLSLAMRSTPPLAHHRRPAARVVLAAVLTLCVSPILAQVSSQQKISDTEGNFLGSLGTNDGFGVGLANLGDLDGDGTTDLAAGTIYHGGGSVREGAAWVLFLEPDGTVRSYQTISEIDGGFTGALDTDDRFGHAVAALGDLDGDGVQDLAVGAFRDDDGGGAIAERGAAWVLFLDTDGTVKSHQKISDTEGGFTGTLVDEEFFGFSLASLGDLDGDGVNDLAVGASGDDDGGEKRGAVWILFLDTDGTVKSHQKISQSVGGFTGPLTNDDRFGTAVTALGDVDGDGVRDLAVGACWDDDGGTQSGAVWILLLNTDGTVKAEQKISETAGGFTGVLDSSDYFGIAASGPGDLDGDGVPDLLVGAYQDDDGGTNRGAVWILFLNDDGTVKAHRKISATTGGFSGSLDDSDHLGFAVAALGDLDDDGAQDVAVAAPGDDDGGSGHGAIWMLFGAGATSEPSLADPASGSTIVACVDIDVSGEGPLGSYGATLSWDETVLDYVGYTGGDAPFDTPVVNEDDVLTGSLAFSDADTTGASGTLHVLCATFDAIGAAGTGSTLDLELTSMFEAGTFDDLLPWAVNDATIDVLLQCTVGDVNGDASINSGDALIVLSHSVGLTIPPTFAERLAARCGDANGDGAADATDAAVMLSFEVGLDVSGNPIDGSNVTVDDCSACDEGGSKTLDRSTAPEIGRAVHTDLQTSTRRVRAGRVFEALVTVETGPARRPLGSYAARLEWDPRSLELLGTLNAATPGFQSPVLNLNDVSRGVLRFADAAPYGAEGRVELLRLQFRARRTLRDPASALHLEFSAMASTAPDFQRLVPR